MSKGRAPILDDFKRREIAAILSMGCSRRAAAWYVGCSPSTIARTARRDAPFAAQLARAESLAEVHYMKNIHSAAKKEQYWRAAAWALERRNPEEYGPRSAETLAPSRVAQLLAELAEIVVAEVPVAAYRKRLVKRFEEVADRFGNSQPRGLPLDQ